MAEAKDCYAIVTKRFQLRTAHVSWLKETQRIYNEILRFYYMLFLEKTELHSLGNQKIMRELERLSIVGRDKKPVEYPLPWKGIPLYFRRAAINTALAAGKSYLSREGQAEPTAVFSAGVTLYKGTYRELTSHSIEIKVYDGERWRWSRCRLSGNTIPEGTLCLSPRLVFDERRAELHVPIQKNVPDGRTLKERTGHTMKICSVQFTNRDAIAVCCVVDGNGDAASVRFIRGGKNYAHRCRKVLEKIKISKKAVGEKYGKNDNKRYWRKLKHISNDEAHQISRQIIVFCAEAGVGVILLPRYSKEFTKYVMAAVGNWSPLHLNYQIRSHLKYKAWQAGMLVLESEVHDIDRYCALCGGTVHKQGEMFICENGHRGNRHVNAAWNLGKRTVQSLSKHML